MPWITIPEILKMMHNLKKQRICSVDSLLQEIKEWISPDTHQQKWKLFHLKLL